MKYCRLRLSKPENDLIIVEDFQYEKRNWQLRIGWEILTFHKNSYNSVGIFVVWINGDRVDDFPRHKQFDKKTTS